MSSLSILGSITEKVVSVVDSVGTEPSHTPNTVATPDTVKDSKSLETEVTLLKVAVLRPVLWNFRIAFVDIPLKVLPAQVTIPVGLTVSLSVISNPTGFLSNKTVSAEKSVEIPPIADLSCHIDFMSLALFSSIAIIVLLYSVDSLIEICSPTMNFPDV